MIRITKDLRKPPAILVAKTTLDLVAQMKDEHDSRGITEFEFDKTIYGHKSVKEALITKQNKKCCFCESKVTHISHGDVEHFRPKGGYLTGLLPKGKLKKPGYYWLAYKYDNLYFACQICNQSYKKNHFPLKDEGKRFHPRTRKVSQEVPLMLDPGKEDPAKHITFVKELATPKRNSLHGKVTIERTGIDREDLNERRRNLLTMLQQLEKNNLSPIISDSLKRENQKLIIQAGQPDAEYSAMVRANFPQYFTPKRGKAAAR